MVKTIPDGWYDYTNIGRQISGTRFIAFKTPLHEYLQNERNKFSTRTLIDSCTLGLVINLTFKMYKPYYNSEDLERVGISYKAIPIKGRSIPGNNGIFNFNQTVEQFLSENKHNDKLIGVHCTHGLNRTGFMICRYMIDCLNIPPDQAIIEFNSARGHEQHRPYLLDSLRTVNLSDSYKNWRKQMLNKTSNGSQLTMSAENDAWSSPNNFQPISCKRKASFMDNDRSNKRRKFSYSDDQSRYAANNWDEYSDRYSPSIGKTYYQNYYRGHVHPQYTMDYYHWRRTEAGPSSQLNVSSKVFDSATPKSATISGLVPSTDISATDSPILLKPITKDEKSDYKFNFKLCHKRDTGNQYSEQIKHNNVTDQPKVIRGQIKKDPVTRYISPSSSYSWKKQKVIGNEDPAGQAPASYLRKNKHETPKNKKKPMLKKIIKKIKSISSKDKEVQI